MKKTRSSLRRLTTAALLTAVAFMLSYLEAILPFSIGIPGVKLGLCHIVTVFALRRLSPWETVAVTAVRICLTTLLFGNMATLAYSAAGAAISIAAMLILACIRRKAVPLFSPVGISIVGGVAHNLGQITVAAILMSTPSLAWYLPVLILSGILTGTVVGAVGALAITRVPVQFTKHT